MKIEILKQKNKQKVAILWFWKEWKTTLNFLEKLDFTDITVLDKNENIEKKEGIKYVLWEKYMDNLSEYSIIFKTPWISPYLEKIAPYRDKLLTQAQIFFSNYIGKVIWITGTKWKSTTSTLTHEILKELWYKVKLVWNIWNPVLDEIDILSENNYDYIVFELSSYMLENLDADIFIWVINNIYDCHLDWHNWRENYKKAKINIVKRSKFTLINYELKELEIFKNNEKIKYFWKNWNYYFKDSLFHKNEQVILKDENIALQWEHNRKNISAILWILDIIDHNNFIDNIEIFKKVLKNFNWLSHRIENIWEYNWITFIDDAIATTPESTIAAIKTFWKNIQTIFLWWQDSWFEFEKLKQTLKEFEIQNIVLFPDTWEKIFWDLSKYNYETNFILDLWEYKPKIFKTKSMKNAVDFAYKNTQEWKICILSNAAPSFSLWTWYIQKWEEFQQEVKNYILK